MDQKDSQSGEDWPQRYPGSQGYRLPYCVYRESHKTCQVTTGCRYCWIARDVMAAMLVVKNNSLSLRWELNFIFMQILRQKIVLF